MHAVLGQMLVLKESESALVYLLVEKTYSLIPCRLERDISPRSHDTLSFWLVVPRIFYRFIFHFPRYLSFFFRFFLFYLSLLHIFLLKKHQLISGGVGGEPCGVQSSLAH
jgi:hypothetical protein